MPSVGFYVFLRNARGSSFFRFSPCCQRTREAQNKRAGKGETRGLGGREEKGKGSKEENGHKASPGRILLTTAAVNYAAYIDRYN